MVLCGHLGFCEVSFGPVGEGIFGGPVRGLLWSSGGVTGGSVVVLWVSLVVIWSFCVVTWVTVRSLLVLGWRGFLVVLLRVTGGSVGVFGDPLSSLVVLLGLWWSCSGHLWFRKRISGGPLGGSLVVL